MINLENIPTQSHYPTKPTKIVSTTTPSVEQTPSRLEKHVRWLKEDRSGFSRVGIVALAVIETIALACTGIGIITLHYAFKEARKINLERAFYKEVNEKPGKGFFKIPSDDKIELKSATRTFNHVFDFAIESGYIWSRSRNSSEDWTPIYFDGYPKKHPISIDADGANLIVLDENHRVHYKKVLEEFRGGDLAKKDPLNIKGQVDLEKDAYVAVDRRGENNWYNEWFSLPVVHHVFNAIYGKKLKLPEGKAWAISHRGCYNNYLEDAIGQHHPVETGVTTLYVLDKNGKDILKYDPWSPLTAKMSISLPESRHATFEAENMSASSSTLMVIGYETEKNGEGTTKTLQIQSRLVDIDSEGWNPGLKYDYVRHPDDKDVRVIPLPDWQKHPIKLEGQAGISKNITIIQIGEGNDQRELRVEGVNSEGLKGFYYKHIDKVDDDWKFQQSPNQDVGLSSPILETEIVSQAPFSSTVGDYTAHDVKASPETAMANVHLDLFGKRSYDSTLSGQIDGERFQVQLHRKKTLKNFLGFNGDSFDVYVPESNFLGNKIFQEKLLKGKQSTAVKVNEKAGEVLISGKGFSFAFRKDK